MCLETTGEMAGKSCDTNARFLSLAFTVALAIALDLHNLGSQPFWFDEALSAAIASSHGADFVRLAFEREVNMAFYYFMLHSWLMLVPNTDFNIRLLSCIFAVAAIPVMYLLVNKVFGATVALAAALLLAVNPSFVQYAQEARSYTLTLLLTLMSWSLLIDCCLTPTPVTFIMYILTTVLAIYSHNLAMLILPAQGVAALSLQHAWHTRIQIGKAMCVAFLLVLPLFPIAAYWEATSASWIAASIGSPGLRTLREVTVAFAGGIPPPRIRQRTLEGLFAFGIVMYVINFGMRVRTGRIGVGSYVSVAAGFGIPIAELMLVSQIVPMFIVRYVLICLPFFLAMSAVGWVELPWRWLTAFGVGLLVVMSLWSEWAYYSSPSKPNWKEAIEYLAGNVRCGDKVAFVPASGRLEFERSVRRFGFAGPEITIVYPRRTLTYEVAGNSSDSLTNSRLPFERLWIVRSALSGDQSEKVLHRVVSKYPVVLRKDFRGVSLFFCNRESEKTAKDRDSEAGLAAGKVVLTSGHAYEMPGR